MSIVAQEKSFSSQNTVFWFLEQFVIKYAAEMKREKKVKFQKSRFGVVIVLSYLGPTRLHICRDIFKYERNAFVIVCKPRVSVYQI